MAEPMDVDKGKGRTSDAPSTSGKSFDLPWVSGSISSSRGSDMFDWNVLLMLQASEAIWMLNR